MNIYKYGGWRPVLSDFESYFVWLFIWNSRSNIEKWVVLWATWLYCYCSCFPNKSVLSLFSNENVWISGKYSTSWHTVHLISGYEALALTITTSIFTVITTCIQTVFVTYFSNYVLFLINTLKVPMNPPSFTEAPAKPTNNLSGNLFLA